ncbi:hypothetical protein TRFO_30551 [Tritrichomonas foetus]|uniref:DUF3447 domain-containing protein n=1 Tax=Tritrichomonas foetus TaxID=1144522 RepID=A0A1J4JTF9_9EUKA|nr:hypothetical protein TRFO_30551 [Tritrichomonas foetus]|eukprot:OHT02409.1 hypothetical protein TRFO_30551 [Tritrichomonas foetus]
MVRRSHMLGDSINELEFYNTSLSQLIECQNIFDKLNSDRLDESITQANSILSSADMKSTFINFLLGSFKIFPDKIELIVDMINQLDKKYKNEIKSKLLNRYTPFRHMKNQQEVFFAILHLIHINYIESSEISHLKDSLPPNMVHLSSEKCIDCISKLSYKYDFSQSDYIQVKDVCKTRDFSKHIEKALSGYDWLRKDDVDHIVQKGIQNFRYYSPSIYERSIFLSRHKGMRRMEMIEAIVYCNAVKCFKYFVSTLYSPPKKLFTLTKYCIEAAVASGSIEMIHLIEDNFIDVTYDVESIKFAIQYHHQDILEWIIENKEIKWDISDLIETIFKYYNFKALKYLCNLPNKKLDILHILDNSIIDLIKYGIFPLFLQVLRSTIHTNNDESFHLKLEAMYLQSIKHCQIEIFKYLYQNYGDKIDLNLKLPTKDFLVLYKDIFSTTMLSVNDILAWALYTNQIELVELIFKDPRFICCDKNRNKYDEIIKRSPNEKLRELYYSKFDNL